MHDYPIPLPDPDQIPLWPRGNGDGMRDARIRSMSDLREDMGLIDEGSRLRIVTPPARKEAA